MDEKFEKLLAGFLDDNQSEEDKKLMAAAMQAGEIKEEQINNLQNFYHQLSAVPEPEPSPNLRQNFYRMLVQEKQKEALKKDWRIQPQRWLEAILGNFIGGRLAYSIVLIGLGVALGIWYNHRPNPESEKLAALTGEMQQMKKMMMLTMLAKPSATQRLKAVNLTSDLETADSKVIQALLQTLNHDASVNVRLAAIEALYEHAANPVARQGLVQSIGQQDSPLVQLALADIMVAMQEKNAVQPLKKLLKQENLNEAVKVKVKQSIQVLI